MATQSRALQRQRAEHDQDGCLPAQGQGGSDFHGGTDRAASLKSNADHRQAEESGGGEAFQQVRLGSAGPFEGRWRKANRGDLLGREAGLRDRLPHAVRQGGPGIFGRFGQEAQAGLGELPNHLGPMAFLRTPAVDRARRTGNIVEPSQTNVGLTSGDERQIAGALHFEDWHGHSACPRQRSSIVPDM